MPMKTQPAAAWLCAGAGLLIQMILLALTLRKREGFRGIRLLALLLPPALALGLARGGFALLQWEEGFADFRWCFTTGLLGLALGTALAARTAGAKSSEVLDENAVGICLAMAAARLSQRWLGETGIGPILDGPGLFAMISEWDEPILAAWLIETLICLAAALAVRLAGRKRKDGRFCLALFCLLIPQILAEQFRSGAYLRYRMMRLEQALYFAVVLCATVYLCRRARGGLKAYAPVLAEILTAAGIAVTQFLLDGKIAEVPAALSWTLYGIFIAGMLAAAVIAWIRAEKPETEGNKRTE